MDKLLVHIITGVENPSRSVLGFLVAKSAIEDGNDVTIFCAGDGVTSLHEITTSEMQGVGPRYIGRPSCCVERKRCKTICIWKICSSKGNLKRAIRVFRIYTCNSKQTSRANI